MQPHHLLPVVQAEYVIFMVHSFPVTKFSTKKSSTGRAVIHGN
jgi:hypothetical protein